jgi:FkbM family methyltransferase
MEYINIPRKFSRTLQLFSYIRPAEYLRGVWILFGLAAYLLVARLTTDSTALRTVGRRSVTLRIDGVRYRIPMRPGDLGVIFDCAIDAMYEAVPGFLPQPGGTCLDVGANIGACTARWCGRYAPGRVIAVEPHPETFERLTTNMELNSWPQIECVQAAISSHSGTLNMRIVPEHSMAVAGHGATTTVAALTLSSLMEQRNIQSVDICKIDVEGHESAVLEGARKVLPQISRIILEYHSPQQREIIEELLIPHFKIVADLRSPGDRLLFAQNKSASFAPV